MRECTRLDTFMYTMYTHTYAYTSTDMQAAVMISLTHAPPKVGVNVQG